MVIKDGRISKIVELKCPSSCKEQAMVDFHEKKCNVSYLKFSNDIVELRQSTVYYTQCQVQMYVCGLDMCDLFIYIPVANGSICIHVQRDEKFLQEVVLKCEDFYFQPFYLNCIKKFNVTN